MTHSSLKNHEFEIRVDIKKKLNINNLSTRNKHKIKKAIKMLNYQ